MEPASSSSGRLLYDLAYSGFPLVGTKDVGARGMIGLHSHVLLQERDGQRQGIVPTHKHTGDSESATSSPRAAFRGELIGEVNEDGLRSTISAKGFSRDIAAARGIGPESEVSMNRENEHRIPLRKALGNSKPARQGGKCQCGRYFSTLLRSAFRAASSRSGSPDFRVEIRKLDALRYAFFWRHGGRPFSTA